MEEVVDKFNETFISKELVEEDKSNFEGLYKNWGKLGNQEERRREILEVQKWYVRDVFFDILTIILYLLHLLRKPMALHKCIVHSI